jgi:enterochelin esterase-like enzyme
MWLLSLAVLPMATARAADDYVLGADSQRQPGVPEGTVTKKRWVSEKIFPGTERDFWVYVPQQYKGTEPAALLVLQDGGAYVDPQGQFRTTIVLDNLIHQGAIPVTIAVFINPGQIPATAEGQKPRANRSFEYDTLSDQYARFLLEELLPEVGRELKLTADPVHRVIGGISSGAICAFTAAWERPDAFGKVLSTHSVWHERIADSRCMIDQARLLTLKAAHMMDTVGNKVAKAEIAMIKVIAPNMACQIVDWAMQAHGGAGISQVTPLAYMYAHQRTLRFADGPDEVHRQAIAKLELGRHSSIPGAADAVEMPITRGS